MNSTVQLTFRYLENDYVRALQAHHASRIRLRLDMLVVASLFAVGVFLWRSPASHWLGVASVVVAVLFVLMLITAFTVVPRLTFRREPKFRDEYSLTFSPEGIHFRTARIDSRLEWSLYSHALIDSHSYILYYGTRRFTVIPKRVFPSADQRQAFESLLTQHISEIVRRDPSP